MIDLMADSIDTFWYILSLKKQKTNKQNLPHTIVGKFPFKTDNLEHDSIEKKTFHVTSIVRE